MKFQYIARVPHFRCEDGKAVVSMRAEKIFEVTEENLLEMFRSLELKKENSNGMARD